MQQASDLNIKLANQQSNTASKTPMKAVILAGGLGTRLSEETHLKPKPMVGNWRAPNPVAHHEDLFTFWR